jgi:hypothetical protein
MVSPRPYTSSQLDRVCAWLVTGAPGRGVAFAIDFAVAAWTMLRARRN